MTKVYKDLDSLSKSLKPEIKRLNDTIVSNEMSDIESQASRLLRDINSMWAGYENSYTPTMYERTGATKSGFSIGRPRIENEGGKPVVKIDLILDDGSMWHDSVFGKGYSKGHSFMLISEGWRAPALEKYKGGPIYRFTYFDGVGIVDSLINEYNTNKYEFEFYYDGEEYGGKRDRSSTSFTR